MCVPVKVWAASGWPSTAPLQVPTAVNSVSESDDTRAGRQLCRYSMQRLSTRPPSVMSAIFMRGDVRRDHASAKNNQNGMFTTKLVTTSLRERWSGQSGGGRAGGPPRAAARGAGGEGGPGV